MIKIKSEIVCVRASVYVCVRPSHRLDDEDMSGGPASVDIFHLPV